MDIILNTKAVDDEYILFHFYHTKQFKDNKMEVLNSYKLLETQNKEGRTLLNLACYDLDYDLANFLLCKNVNVNTKDKYGNTPLHNCIHMYRKDKEKALNLIISLLNKGCDVESINNYGYTLLQLACLYNFEDLSLILLEKYCANPNGCFVEKNITHLYNLPEIPAPPLFYALYNRNKLISNKLLESGAIHKIEFKELKEKNMRLDICGDIFRDIHAIFCTIYCSINSKKPLTEFEDKENLEIFKSLLTEHKMDPNIEPASFYPFKCLKILVRKYKWDYVNILLKDERTIVDSGLYFESMRKNCPMETTALFLKKGVSTLELEETYTKIILPEQTKLNLKNNKKIKTKQEKLI